MKKIITLVVLLASIYNCNAQFTTIAGTGLSFSPNSTKYINVYVPNTNDSAVISFQRQVLSICGFFYPKYHIKQAKPGRGESYKPYSISVGAPLLVGAQFGFGATNFTYSIYPTADINFGSCNPNLKNKIGAYFGVGVGVQNTNNVSISNPVQTTLAINTKKYKTIADGATPRGLAMNVGPLVHLGFEFPGLFYPGTKNGLRFAFQPALNKQGATYYTICLQQGLRGRMGF